MFVSSTIDVDKLSKVSLNVTMLFIDMPLFHSAARFLHISKEVVANSTRYDWMCSENKLWQLIIRGGCVLPF